MGNVPSGLLRVAREVRDMPPSPIAMADLLVVDDEETVRRFLAITLEEEGHIVATAADGVEALALLRERSFHVVLADLTMPRMDGMTLLKTIRRDFPETEVIVLTGYGSVESAVSAMKAGAFEFLEKPLSSPAALTIVVDRAVERRRLRAVQEIAVGNTHPPLGYGAPAMQAVERALQKVAATDATVLLMGESGTGKEIAARSVHDWSGRAHGPFVAVNCAALSSTLLESELFGHEKGAFTGAYARQRGRIELAEGGTFFLDEVGELEPGLQARLLRVIQEKRFERVGGQQAVDANVRWIAATNRDLPCMVSEGRFREDLYHRIAVFPVRMPPLRQRREDIAPLAERLLGRIAISVGRPQLRLSPEATQTLSRWDWPGNVRELANVLERSAILAEANEIRSQDLELFSSVKPGVEAAPAMLPDLAPLASARRPEERTPPQGLETTQLFALDERSRIMAALERCAGNQTRAAQLLGISRGTLVNRLTEYDMPRPRKRAS
jgi:two-component system, NtrC family, response regulator AtoC